MKQVAKVRNYGIDMLRIVAMYMIVALHCLGAGGVRSNATGGQYAIAWLFESVCYCAVDCYGLISGFVNGSKQISRPNRMLKLWIQVLFYSFGAFLVCALTKTVRPDTNDVLLALFPISTNHYWYVSSYMGLILLMPYCNTLIDTLDRKKAKLLLEVLFLTFSCYAVLALRVGDPFGLNGGYSMIWLVFLYLAGACLKRFEFFMHTSRHILLITFALCVCASWLWKILVPEWLSPSWPFSYTSPTVLIPAVCLVGLFQEIRFSGRRTIGMIRAIAPATLGVYLIHENKLIRTLLIDRFIWVGTVDIWLFPICMVLIPAMLFAVCCLIEIARLMLFRLFRIDNLTARFSAFIIARCRRTRLFRE